GKGGAQAAPFFYLAMARGGALTLRRRRLCGLEMNSVAELPVPPSLSELSARGPIALFLDSDGTLVEIAGTPNTIDVPQRLAERLRALADRLGGRLALVSGRAVANLEQHCGPLGIACAGSHGLSRFSAARERLGEEPRSLLPA